MTFVQNLDAFLKVTGPENGHIAWFLAEAPWPTDADRDQFAAALQTQDQ